MRNDKTLFQKQAVYHKNRFSELKQCLFSPCNSENPFAESQIISMAKNIPVQTPVLFNHNDKDNQYLYNLL